MSRNWSEHKYTSAEDLWFWIDELIGTSDSDE